MDSRKLAKDAQLTQYGESKAKTVVQGETQNAVFERQGAKWASAATIVVPVTVSRAVAAPSPDSVVFLRGYSTSTQLHPFCAVILSLKAYFNCQWIIYLHHHLRVLPKKNSIRDLI